MGLLFLFKLQNIFVSIHEIRGFYTELNYFKNFLAIQKFKSDNSPCRKQ
ncbi:hypothetical protein Cabys_1861 [Caldithrix abyssi DSM 13497]|uniref:Uncharacterized protein n=1 Tax=Caldithrix abyssi DSM 13497 TaxID=880073 RepID=A0A1J1C9D9_CALAY|nr:hypothetical protein Cabys_1861 [Caldithrix abyssi DSM 13497]